MGMKDILITTALILALIQQRPRHTSKLQSSSKYLDSVQVEVPLVATVPGSRGWNPTKTKAAFEWSLLLTQLGLLIAWLILALRKPIGSEAQGRDFGEIDRIEYAFMAITVILALDVLVSSIALKVELGRADATIRDPIVNAIAFVAGPLLMLYALFQIIMRAYLDTNSLSFEWQRYVAIRVCDAVIPSFLLIVVITVMYWGAWKAG
ncbi:hypothetical protein AX16_008570 [Volvariella volvacea WC 439]|nr:hypothetical protein AX16_008570 [Volvariella volvacea WC 439]